MAAGGSGVVYLARDTVSGVEVALKTLHPLLKTNTEEMERLREKFALVHGLTHPNIAKALVLHPCRDIECRMQNGGDGGGTPLATDHWPLATFKIRVRILDFGLAAEIRSSMSRVSTETGDTSGTRPYMAPEQWLGKKQDGRTDQYALACVLYELLAGEPPFAGVFETGDPIIMRTAEERDVPEESEEVPPAVNAALQKALSKDPKERFGNCAEFVEAMSHTPQGKDGSHGVLAPPDAVTPWERGHPARGTSDTPKRHSRWPWLLAGAAAFALGLGLWRTGATGGESDPPATPPGGPTAVSAATSGGVATATSTVSTAAPVLPPATATRAELEDALAQLESRRDALASQGYAVEDLERKPVEEALGQPRSIPPRLQHCELRTPPPRHPGCSMTICTESGLG